MKKIAIIGGSGFENPNIIDDHQLIEINTPYGPTSSEFRTGKIGDRRSLYPVKARKVAPTSPNED
jgi:purine nucleoside phosphorylase